MFTGKQKQSLRKFTIGEIENPITAQSVAERMDNLSESIEEVCEDCGGTGEVSFDVSDGEGNIQRGVGSKQCPCRKRDIEADMDDDS